MKGDGERFARVPLWAARAKEVGVVGRVLIALCAHIDRKGCAYPSLETLAELAGIKSRHAARALATLEETGLIRRDRSTGGRGHSTRYQVFMRGSKIVPNMGVFEDENSPLDDTLSQRNSPKSGSVSTAKQSQIDPLNSPKSGTGSIKNKERAHHAPARDDLFIKFWQIFPKRDGDNPKAAARKAFEAALNKGADPDAILRGARDYARRSAETVPDDQRRYIPMAVTWLKQHRWEDDPPATPKAPDPDQPRSYSRGNRP